MKLQKLGDIVKNLDSKRIPLNSEERIAKSKEGLYPYIGANNIVGYIDEYIFDEKILCVAEDGGSWGANQKCAVIYKGKTWVNNHAHVLAENGKANLEYLKNYLNYTNLNKYIKGSTRGKLNKSILENIRIPLPPLPEQLQIANLLSKAENLISQRKESIRLLDEFLKSTFLEMFGDPVRNEKQWGIVGIETVCTDIFLGLTNKVDYVENAGFPLIRTTDIKGGKLSFENVRFISEVQHRRITKNRISKRGDILVSKSGTLGTTAIVDTDIEFTTYESIITIQTNPFKLINHYLNFLLKNTNFQIKMLGGKTGGTVSHLNLLMFREITLPLPPIELQTKFAHIVEKTEALKTQYQQSLNELENLYASLSQRAFRGELKIKGEGFSYAKAVEDKLAMAAEGESSYLKKKRSGH